MTRLARLWFERALNRHRAAVAFLSGAAAVVACAAAVVALTGPTARSTGPDAGDTGRASSPAAAPAGAEGSRPVVTTADVPANDAGAVSRLTRFAVLLRTDPRTAARHSQDVLGIYQPARGPADPTEPTDVAASAGNTGGRVGGRFVVAGGSGACYAVEFSADRKWLTSGDMSGVVVTGPSVVDADACH